MTFALALTYAVHETGPTRRHRWAGPACSIVLEEWRDIVGWRVRHLGSVVASDTADSVESARGAAEAAAVAYLFSGAGSA